MNDPTTPAQPAALMLAEALEQQFPTGTAQAYLDGEAASELRRLHAQVVALTVEKARLETLIYQGMDAMRQRLREEFDRVDDLISKKRRDGSDPFEGWYD